MHNITSIEEVAWRQHQQRVSQQTFEKEMGYNFGQGQRQHHHGWCRPDVKRPHFIPFLACLGRQKNRHQSVSRACEIGSCQCISSLFRPSSLQRTTAIHSSRPGQEMGTPGLRSTIHPILLLLKVIIKMCYWMTLPWCIYHLGLLSPPMPTRAWTPSNGHWMLCT